MESILIWQLLLQETWVNPKPELVQSFFDWVEQTNFYKFHYSKTEEALETIQKIFQTK